VLGDHASDPATGAGPAFAGPHRPGPATAGPVTTIRALYARFRQLIHEAGRFGVVGLAGLVVTDGGANLLTYRAGLNPAAATAIAVVAATGVTFLGSRYWTFRHRQRACNPREGVTFLAINALGRARPGRRAGPADGPWLSPDPRRPLSRQSRGAPVAARTTAP